MKLIRVIFAEPRTLFESDKDIFCETERVFLGAAKEPFGKKRLFLEKLKINFLGELIKIFCGAEKGFLGRRKASSLGNLKWVVVGELEMALLGI